MGVKKKIRMEVLHYSKYRLKSFTIIAVNTVFYRWERIQWPWFGTKNFNVLHDCFFSEE